MEDDAARGSGLLGWRQGQSGGSHLGKLPRGWGQRQSRRRLQTSSPPAPPPRLLSLAGNRPSNWSTTLLSRWRGFQSLGVAQLWEKSKHTFLGAGWQEGSGEAAHSQNPEGS